MILSFGTQLEKVGENKKEDKIMTLVKFNNGVHGYPKRSLSPFFGDLMDNFWSGSFSADPFTNRIPAVNISENETQFLIELAAPGLSKESFKIHLDKEVLTITAEQKEESKEEKSRFTRKEFNFGSFHRNFTLPESADQENISAEYLNGILQVRISKKAEAKVLSREINVA